MFQLTTKFILCTHINVIMVVQRKVSTFLILLKSISIFRDKSEAQNYTLTHDRMENVE